MNDHALHLSFEGGTVVLTGGSAFISQPLAIVVIGGLLSSTLLTLLLVPVLYELVERGDSAAELLEAVYAKTGYTAELEASEDPQDASRVDNLAELVTVAREFAGDAAVADAAVARLPALSLR